MTATNIIIFRKYENEKKMDPFQVTTLYLENKILLFESIHARNDSVCNVLEMLRKK